MINKIKKIDFESIKTYLKTKLISKKSIKISQKQKINFFDSLYNLVNSGIPITNSVSIMLFQTKDKNIKIILETIVKDINKGKKLQESLESFSNVFSIFDIYMIKMGELTGKIANSFEIIKNREEKNADLKSKVLGALIYPIIIICLSIAMIFGFMLFVIPKVQKMYSDAKVNLPSLTQHVIDISVFLQKNYIFIFLGLLIGLFLLTIFKNNPKTKIYYDNYVLKIPLFGDIIRKKILIIFCHTLGTLLQNGIMINEALEISKKSLNNAYYEKRVSKMEESLNEGIKLSELMGINKLKEGINDEYFPIEIASIVKIGEQTGKMPGLLINISGKFSKELDVIVKNLSVVIEPVVIIFIGAIVGTMIMAILLPFFNMVNVL